MTADKKFEEIVKQSLRKTINQGKRSINGACRYRSSEQGVCCIIGHCIPDDDYNYSIEGVDVYGIHQLLNDSFGFDLTLDQLNVLYTLQICHDGLYETGDFVKDLRHDIEANVLNGNLPTYCLSVFQEY
jgi:hypothetical protein